MKKLLYPLAFALTAFLFVYSCSTEEEDTTPPPQVQQPTPEPEPEVSQYTLTVTAGEGGTVSTEGGTYDEGTEVTITATPEEGYDFVGWEGSDSDSNSLTVTLNGNTSVQAIFSLISSLPFNSISESFSQINQTTSWYKVNYYSTKYIFANNDNYETFRVDESEDEFLHWRPLTETVKFADLNGDNLVDMFCLMNKVDNSGFAMSGPGKYVIYSDVYRDDFNFQNPIVYETEIVFWGDTIIQDFDNDGINDVIIGAYQNHNNKSLPLIKPKILYFNSDFSYEEYDIGFVANQHCLSAGDINNDGLIDLVQIAFVGLDDNLPDANFPNTWINQGGRNNFNKIELIKESSFSNNWDRFNILYYDLFDLNNDGYLDILAGQDLVNDKYVQARYNMGDRFFEESMEGPFVLWGDGTGQFSINNISYTDNVSFPYDSQDGHIKIMGGGFSDFDNDGDIDFFISAELQDYDVLRTDFTGRAYDNYILQLYENKGNNQFIDVTQVKINGYTKFNPAEFTWFRRTSAIDKDGDGDYDIIPRPFNGAWNPNTNSWSDLYRDVYWENTGGQFVRRELD